MSKFNPIPPRRDPRRPADQGRPGDRRGAGCPGGPKR
jgi:hypothetical protein